MNPEFRDLLGADGKLRPGSKQALERDLRHARGEVDRLLDEVSALSDRLDQLSTFSMAIWDLLKEKTGLRDEELNESIAKISEQRNEQLARGAEKCRQCGRVMSRRHGRCLYCSPSL